LREAKTALSKDKYDNSITIEELTKDLASTTEQMESVRFDFN